MEFSVSSLSELFTSCPAAQVTAYEPTEVNELGEYSSMYCNICAQLEYQQFSPEELRLSYYQWQEREEIVNCDEGQQSETQEMIEKTGSASFPSTRFDNHDVKQEQVEEIPEEIESSPPSKPRVRLPPIIAGVVNPAAVSNLQNELEQLALKVSWLERALKQRGARKPYEELESKVTRLEWELEKERASSIKLKEEMEATLLRRSEKMKAEINRRLIQEKEALKADALQRLSEPQVRELLEINPTLKAVFEDMMGQQIASLPDAQIRELLSANPTIKAILANGLKKKLELETARLEREHEAALRTSLRIAETEMAQAVLMEGKKSSLKIILAENRFRVADHKLKAVEEAASATPGMPVKTVWEKFRSLEVTDTGRDSPTINKSTVDIRSLSAAPSLSPSLPRRQVQSIKTVSDIRISSKAPQTNGSRLAVSPASTDVSRSHEVRRQSSRHNPAGSLPRSSMNSPAPTHPLRLNRMANPAGVKRTRDVGDIGTKDEQPKKPMGDVKK